MISFDGLKQILIKLLLIAISTAIALVIAELVLRLCFYDSSFGTGKKLKYMKEADTEKVWTVDPDFGFRPVLGNDQYNEYGTKVNRYGITKETERERLLFVGDSVTARGEIIEGVKALYGEKDFEYWNAGVESFNTVQEVKFYEKYNYKIKPDHVILTFHLNDFETTPVVFINKENKLMVYTPKIPGKYINPFLFKNSCVYRLYLGVLIGIRGLIDPKSGIEKEVRENLAELKQLLDKDNIVFTVLVHPALKPYQDWNVAEKHARDKILEILQELKIRHFDLYYVLDEAVRDKVNMVTSPGDSAHPSRDMAEYFSKYLYRNSLLLNK